MKTAQMLNKQSDSFMTMQVADKLLYSVFQPIYSFSNLACVGVEALLRGNSVQTGMYLSVPDCLSVPDELDANTFNQNLNRLHIRNWQSAKLPNTWLFLNLDVESIHHLDNLCIGDLVEELSIKGHELVIEIVENEITDEVFFEKVVKKLRASGCLIALDDFGAGHSNVNRIWMAQPDIVKLDRGILLEASKSVRGLSILENLTRLIKQAGSICLLEGIETQAQALIAMDAGVDLVQGFYFARPRQTLDQVKQGQECIAEVADKYPAHVAERQVIANIQRVGYASLLEELFDADDLADLEVRMMQLAQLSFIKRYYILDEQGYQISEEHYCVLESEQVNVLRQGKGLCWKNRDYFVQARGKPEELYISKPYRSLIDMQLCLTISKSFVINKEVLVACFDVIYHDKSTETVQISV